MLSFECVFFLIPVRAGGNFLKNSALHQALLNFTLFHNNLSDLCRDFLCDLLIISFSS